MDAIDPSGSLTVGVIAIVFGLLIALNPYRFLHPFKGKSVHHPRRAMIFMRIAGGWVAIGGFWQVSKGIWLLFTHTQH
jgi:hypothetical protein